MGVADCVNNEVKELLKNRIIRYSRSPYSNPVWVFDKKVRINTANTQYTRYSLKSW